jgi:hypothetical protein
MDGFKRSKNNCSLYISGERDDGDWPIFDQIMIIKDQARKVKAKSQKPKASSQ